MDNHSIAVLLDETADLLEISAADPFRVRSYRRAAEAVEASTTQLSTIVGDLKQLLSIPGIGKGMAATLQEIEKAGTFPLREELMLRYKPGMLQLLKLPGMGPKSVALLWESLQVGSIEELQAALADGRVAKLPRFGDKQVEKLRAGIEDYKKNSGRYKMDAVGEASAQLTEYLEAFPGLTRIEPAGSLRRGRETSGDLDMLVTGPACAEDCVAAAVDYVAAYPRAATLLAKGANKVSFRMRSGLQVDVRLLPEGSWGAAMQYFTGSKMHNVSLRQRALRKGYTLSEYALARVDDGSFVAGRTEEEIYNALGLAWIPPELRENNGELEAAQLDEAGGDHLPQLITRADIRGDVHAHTVATDGANTIREMAEAALARGYGYLAITDHSKNLSMVNGLDDARALEHIARIRQVDRELARELGDLGLPTIRVFAGIEVDILADGAIDLSNEVLAQMDVVIASMHSAFALPAAEQTERMLLALENPYVRILGHPTGRMLLRREPAAFDMTSVLRHASELGVAVEHNASPSRLDLCDTHLRLARELGCKISVNTDAHNTSEFDKIRYGIRQLRRAWLTPADVLNTLEADAFLAALRPRP